MLVCGGNPLRQQKTAGRSSESTRVLSCSWVPSRIGWFHQVFHQNSPSGRAANSELASIGEKIVNHLGAFVGITLPQSDELSKMSESTFVSSQCQSLWTFSNAVCVCLWTLQLVLPRVTSGSLLMSLVQFFNSTPRQGSYQGLL